MKERIRNTIKYIKFVKSNNALKRSQNKNFESDNVDELIKALEKNIDYEGMEQQIEKEQNRLEIIGNRDKQAV